MENNFVKENNNENKKKWTFQRVMFKLFSCPVLILFLIFVGNFLIFEGVYKCIGWQILVLIALMVFWIRSVNKEYKFKMMISD
ncbi:hypothetical protein KKG48_00075 [Patescibacteria group bacterium]|nr:hypothetical protein [Patescibacteria group bacterium]MCG2694725.1 hypothetical protein [Candidatus Parcubacteria bacterium]